MPLLALDHARLRFGGIVALDDVSLEVAEDSIVGLIGPNGAGKTTAFNAITRLYRPSKTTSPESSRYRRVIALKAVVLPAPFGPIRPTIEWSSTSRETSSSATIPPKRSRACSSVRRATSVRRLQRAPAGRLHPREHPGWRSAVREAREQLGEERVRLP